MKRVLPFLFFFLIVALVAGVTMTGQRGRVIRAELARRGRSRPEDVEPAGESA